jgi:hypothetical protein
MEVSGPFLSLSVLQRVFPQGIDAHDPEMSRHLRLAYEEWLEDKGRGRATAAIHNGWVRVVLRDALELTNEVLLEGQALPPALRLSKPEYGETVRPTLAVAQPEGVEKPGPPRLLVQVYPAVQGLGDPVEARRWKASPRERMAELLHVSGVGLGLVTNGEQWVLVYAPRDEDPGYVSWYSHLWFEESLTLRAFRSLLGAHRFFGVPESDTFESLLQASAADQTEVTTQLGEQVRRAVEVLVQAVDRADKDRGRKLLDGVGEGVLYESALTVMMRLVFLMSAEERGLLLLGYNSVYDQHYAVSTLRDQLRAAADQYGEEVLERRHDAWPRLLAIFRAVHAGVQHEDMRLPPYGGNLFDPDRYPFLEGRAVGTTWSAAQGEPLPIHNRTVLHLLDALQLLRVRVGGRGPVEARRISFRGLDIEQIGHVYETLLDHEARRARSPLLGLMGSGDKEPEVELAALERERERGETALLAFLRESTGRPESALRRALAVDLDLIGAQPFREACDNDEALWERVRPFAGLVRSDSSGAPVVIVQGSVYVTSGNERRSTGTHYTPRSLTEPIVRYTLEPLVYSGPAEGKPREEWRLKSPRDLLDLKVCDMAMGSGAFLVQACRYLSQRLVEAWQEAESRLGGGRTTLRITLYGERSRGAGSEELIPRGDRERIAIARRIVTERCLYGVDKNPIAVEMAKLSLWLITLDKGRPFTFLDHALRCGDSLLGVTAKSQIEHFSFDPARDAQIPLLARLSAPALRRALEKRRELESFPVNDIEDFRIKELLLREAEDALDSVRLIGDLLVGTVLRAEGRRGVTLDDQLQEVTPLLASALDESNGPEDRESRLATLRDRATELLEDGRGEAAHRRRAFHWALDFPEIMAEGGFHALVGNPPFVGGQRITGALGTDYRGYLVERVARGRRGSADLSAYFFLRGAQLLRPGGCLGMLATNTIAQGDTRQVGLEQLLDEGYMIPRAVPSRKWPGKANLEVAHVWLWRGDWRGTAILNEQETPSITSYLTAPGKAQGDPHRLAANADKSFQGSIVLGMGFVLAPEAAQALMEKDSGNRDVLFPYLSGEDLNSRPDQSPSRWVINFRDWPLNRQSAPPDYDGPVAADYPDCLAIVEEKVKPERDRLARGDATAQDRARRWWQFARPTLTLYSAISTKTRVLVIPETTKYCAFAFCPPDIVFSHAVKVLVLEGDSDFALLASTVHATWARRYSSSLETRLRYVTSDAFETFPVPVDASALGEAGEQYHAERRHVMVGRQEGLTAVYNRFHDPDENGDDIRALREAHTRVDHLVVQAYGWTDLDLDHDFRRTQEGVRFTLREVAKQELLDRLLELNHERYAHEVAQGLHDQVNARGAGRRRRAAASAAQSELPNLEMTRLIRIVVTTGGTQ